MEKTLLSADAHIHFALTDAMRITAEIIIIRIIETAKTYVHNFIAHDNQHIEPDSSNQEINKPRLNYARGIEPRAQKRKLA